MTKKQETPRTAFNPAFVQVLAEIGTEQLQAYLEKSKAPQDVQDLANGLAWLNLCRDIPEGDEIQAGAIGAAIGRMTHAIIALGGSFTGTATMYESAPGPAK